MENKQRFELMMDELHNYCSTNKIHLIAIATSDGKNLSFRYNGAPSNLMHLVDTVHDIIAREALKGLDRPN